MGIFTRLFGGPDNGGEPPVSDEESQPVNGHDHESDTEQIMMIEPDEADESAPERERSGWLSPTPRIAGGIQVVPQRAPTPPPLPVPSDDPLADVLDALDDEWTSDGAAAPVAGVSSASDLAAAKAIFDELAVAHVAQVRAVMLELQQGEIAPSWIESSKPALRSLRAMAGQMELSPLCEALDGFCDGVDRAVARDELIRRYQRLIELIPAAFELDAERDRREPIIVESLLRQVAGVESGTIAKLRAVGLDRLDTLLRASAAEMAAASGIRREVAAAIAARLSAYRTASPATVAAPDVGAAHRELRELVAALHQQHDDFERASRAWSDQARDAKRTARRDRDRTFLQIRVVLARLGEHDRIARLDKAAFAERLADLDRLVAEIARSHHKTKEQGGTERWQS